MPSVLKKPLMLLRDEIELDLGTLLAIGYGKSLASFASSWMASCQCGESRPMLGL